MTILIVLTGESYRLGGQMTRGRGGEESKQRQMLASNSHIKLVSMLKEKNVDSDICMITYTLNDEYDKQLCDIYKPYLKYVHFAPTLSSSETVFIDSVTSYMYSNIDLSAYSHIVFIRIDVYLKDYFFKVFELDRAKVIFAHIDSNTKYEYYNGVCHFICIFPQTYFEYIRYRHPHTAASDLAHFIGKENLGLMIPTLHLISTDLEWNPLYIQVGRDNSLTYYLQDKVFDTQTLCVKQTDTIPFDYTTLKHEDILLNILK